MKKLICRKNRKFSKQVISVFILLCFTSLQILPNGWADSIQITKESLQGSETPEAIYDPEIASALPGTLPRNDVENNDTTNSIDFLNDSPLSAVILSEAKNLDPSAPSQDDRNYEFEEYNFEQALDLIRPDFAVAIPIESLTVSELDQLRKLEVEVALVSVKGMNFLLTSGNTNEIKTNREIRDMLEEASFFAHIHPEETESDGPSALDFLVATDQIEYLITQNEILSFNQYGVQERNISDEEFLKRWEQATNLYHRHSEEQSDEESRMGSFADAQDDCTEIASGTSCLRNDNDADAHAWANRFVAAMDRVNQNGIDLEGLRSAGTVAPTAGLTSSSLTSFSGSPWTLLMTGSSASTSLVQQSSMQFQLNYNVTTAGTQSGAYISFDNPTTTATVEVVNLSTLTQLTVGISGPAGAKVRFEVEDSLGVKSEVTLINVSTTMQYYQISKTLFTGLDWTKIKRFTYSIDSTLTSVLTGVLTVQTKTLLYSGTALTDFPNAPYIAIVPGSNAQTNLVESDSFVFKMNYDVTQAGSIAGGSVVLDSPYTSTV